MYKKLILMFLLMISVGVVAVYVFPEYLKYDGPSVSIKGRTFAVEIADTEALRKQGLSGHAPLQGNHGMLFVFPTSGWQGFWMKDMTFSIDIIWISEDLKVAHVRKAVSPDTFPTIFYPDNSARYVLEVASGHAEDIDVSVGDPVTFSL